MIPPQTRAIGMFALVFTLTVILPVATGLGGKSRVRTLVRAGAALETVALLGGLVLVAIPATRETGIVLVFFAMLAGFWHYGSYLTYVHGAALIGNEVVRGVAYMALGILVTLLAYSLELVPAAWWVFLIPGAIAVVGVTIGIWQRLRSEAGSESARATVGVILGAVAIGGYFVFRLVTRQWTDADTLALALIIVLLPIVAFRPQTIFGYFSGNEES